MGKPRKTKRNPYGLTAKQTLVIEDIVNDVKSGKGLNATKSHQKFYTTNNAPQLANQNFNRLDFRQALIDGLTKRKILGQNSKTERRLRQGLDAVSKQHKIIDRDDNGKPIYDFVNVTDYKTRLAYVQEINKIAGVYAPEKKQISKLNINLDMTTEQLRQRNKELKEELQA